MVGPVTASLDSFDVCGVRLFGAGIKCGFGLGGVGSALHAVKAVAEPRLASVVAKGASELTSVAGAGLVGACHDTVMVVSSVPPRSKTYVPNGVLLGSCFG